MHFNYKVNKKKKNGMYLDRELKQTLHNLSVILPPNIVFSFAALFKISLVFGRRVCTSAYSLRLNYRIMKRLWKKTMQLKVARNRCDV